MSERRDFPQARDRMVQDEVIGRGIADPRVIEAMRKVPRHLFLPEAMERDAYGGSALPIGSGQTISAPQMVAMMTEALRLTGGEKILEVGTGSGYQAAVLVEMGCRVISLERIPDLARRTVKLFDTLGLSGIVVKVGDGSTGFKEAAPYDRIIVTAASPRLPLPLVEQLGPEGIMVIPVGDRLEQSLLRYTRREDAVEEEALGRCVFVPLLGREGFSGGEA